jgi:glycosyltransferase involved in cell wall biosynthesis
MAPVDRDDRVPVSPLPPNVRVAVVHDFLYTYAGAEKVLEQILRICPQADLFSLFDFLPADQRQFILNKSVTTSFLQKMPFASRMHRMYLPLMPLAIEQLNVSDYDVVISSSYVAAKGVMTSPRQLHVCYCHSPVRFAWDMQNQYLPGGVGKRRFVRSFIARVILHYIRRWDAGTANNVDSFVANSDFVAGRIQKFYRRQSTTIYPPVAIERFNVTGDRKSYYLTASRLVPYKRIGLIVEAFTRTPERELVVIGEGPEFEKISASAGPNVRMLGYQSFDRLKYYMQHARAFVFAAEEDFGIAPVEAQACGTPVIAYGRGGVTESVIDGKTGVLFPLQTVESLLQAVDTFEQGTWSSDEIRANVERFSTQAFRDNFASFLTDSYNELTRAKKNAEGARLLTLPNDRAMAALVAFAADRLSGLTSELGIGAVGSDLKAVRSNDPETPLASSRVG